MEQNSFSEEDTALLCKIAAGQVHFGRYDTALRILHLALWVDETNPDALTLMAHAAWRCQAMEDLRFAMRTLEKHGHEVPHMLRSRYQMVQAK